MAEFSAIAIDDWTLDAASQRLVRNSEVRQLQPKELGVLLHLVECAPDAVSQEALLARTWANTVVIDNALHRVIGNLRRALGDDARHSRYIETLSRRGYRLSARVVTHAARAMATIAILPLESVSGDPDHEHFAAALTDEIQAQIARLEHIRTIARTSAARFGRAHLDARAIGRQLGADYLLEGSMNRSDQHIRIHLSLVDTADATVRLTRTYQRVLQTTGDLFALYDSIANDIRTALLPIAGVRREAPLRPPSTGNLIAHEIHMAGVSKYEKTGNPQQLLEHAERALALDPTSLEAQFMRLEGIFFEAELGYGPTKASFEFVRQEVLEILERLPEEPWALHLLGRIHAVLDLDFVCAMAAFDAAERAGLPRAELAVWRAAIWLNADKPQRGLEVLREAEPLDPLNPHLKDLLGRCHHLLGERAASYARFDEMLALEPHNRFNFYIAIFHGILADDPERAKRVLDLWQGKPIFQGWPEAAIACLEGEPALLAKWVETAVADRAQHYASAIPISHAYYTLRDYEQHMLWWAQRERNLEILHFVPFELSQYPDYWQKLRIWANDEPGRIALLSQHTARVKRITHRMKV